MKFLRLTQMSLKRSKIFPLRPQKTFRMDSTQILGITLGGLFISALGGVAEYMREKQMPQPKGMIRDFLIGVVLVMFLLQIVPESMGTLFAFLPTLNTIKDSIPAVPSMVGGADIGPDLQIGPARF